MCTVEKGDIEEQIEVILRGGQFRQLMELYFAHIREKYGLKRIELEVLYYLSQGGGQNTAIDVCRALRANKGHVSQAMDNLRKKGLLKACQDSEDRRYFHFILLEPAYEIIRQLTDEFSRLNKAIFNGFDQKELEEFKEMMSRVGKNMDKVIHELEDRR
ncbi:MAG: MarR family winged helix-turn-helix transcriptional regulator [Lachnospiraceae bacterium]